MNEKSHLNIVFILLLSLLLACNLDPLEDDQLQRFDKLYALSENVEAVDFICKPDQSGYIIVGNLQSNENSDIIIIDVRRDGMQQNFHRIRTPYFDEAVSAKLNEADNSVFILLNRKTDAAQSPIEFNMMIKSDLNGIPLKANNATDTLSATFKILNSNDNSIINLNDFLILPPNLISVGTIRQSETDSTSRITQTFDINSTSFNNSSDSIFTLINQKPDSILYNGSANLKVKTGTAPSAIYEVMGQTISENPFGSINGRSQNITWDIYTDIASSSSERIFMGTDKNEEFADILFHSNGKNYIAGNYSDDDSVFLISKEYTGINNNRDQNIYSFAGFGKKVTNLTENEEGTIIMSLIDDDELSSSSSLLKFSQAGLPVESQNFVFESTGLYDIKKIESEPGNILVILSQKTFENNSTAIGLMKIKF